MSLYRQLWIGIAITMMLVFGATFMINSTSSSRYLEQQLTIKNNDEANRIALSLSQQQLDPVALEIQLASLLDQGSYEFVQFRGADGEIMFSRQQRFEEPGAPAWFQALFPIDSKPGSADVSNGWNYLGTLSIKSHDAFAYRELWTSGQRTLVALLSAIVIAGGVASLLLRVVLRPLESVVAQAQAIGERRFVSIAEPMTKELAQLTRSMNALSGRVSDMLIRESTRLGRELESASTDAQTGLLNLATFSDRLAARIDADDAQAQGALALTRIDPLATLNREFGRQIIDNVLRDIGNSLQAWGETDKTLFFGRNAGSEFCVLAPQQLDALQLARTLQARIRDVLQRHELAARVQLPSSGTTYDARDTPAVVLDELNGALAMAAGEQGDAIRIASEGDDLPTLAMARADQWRRRLVAALAEQQLWLQTFPVVDPAGTLLNQEAMVRIGTGDDTLMAGEFLPWVHRLELDGELDRAVLMLGLEQVANTGTPVCINLTVASLEDENFLPWLSGQLATHAGEARLLSANIAEAMAFSHPQGFRRLHDALRAQGARLGIARMGYRVSDIGLLSELGADHLKIDGLFVRGIADNAGNQALLRTYANIASSLGIPCIAEGVASQEDLDAAIACGAVGATGPAIAIA